MSIHKVEITPLYRNEDYDHVVFIRCSCGFYVKSYAGVVAQSTVETHLRRHRE